MSGSLVSLSASRPSPSRGCVIESQRPIIVTIDGPAGTGKSSVARALARRLGLDFLDTGAMYRAAAAIALDRGLTDPDDIVRAVESADLRFDWSTDPPRILAWGQPLGDRIRRADVEAVVSRIAALGALRRHLVAKQRAIAREHRRLVTEGRDQGSVAFPDAFIKFYLDASPKVRARRRWEQAGRPGDVESMEREILLRDQMDASRLDGPLICPADAVRIDTSDLTFDEVVGHLEAVVRSSPGWS